MKLPNVAYCVKNHLCTGCGICQDVCPQGAISIKIKHNINVPLINRQKCKNNEGCNRCFVLCSGKGMELQKINAECYGKEAHNSIIRFYHSCYTGHAEDDDLRFHAASGGCVSSFLLFLLESNLMGGAVVRRFSEFDPFKTEVFLAKSKEDILSAKSSKYCPVSMQGILSEIEKVEYPVAIVGLPCHIQAFRNIAKNDRTLCERLIFIGLFCSGTKDHRAVNFICKRNHIKKQKVKKFAYRDDGCLGFMKIEYLDGKIQKIPYRKAYQNLHSFFKPERCVTCIDHFSMLADISFGDIDVLPYSDDHIGSNSIICRSEYHANLLKSACSQNYLRVKEIDVSEILKSQRILDYRMKLYRGHCFINRFFRLPLVNYDMESQSSFSLGCIKADIIYRIQKLLSKIKLIS
jgi:coenzyme F420 hydrogenase subunit beta